MSLMVSNLKYLSIAALLSASVFVCAEEKSFEIPLVPVKAMLDKAPVEQKRHKPIELKPVTIDMKPGINEIVAIAKGHLNRVVTPFASPKVATVSNANITTEENIIYVSSDDIAPVTLFITQSDSEATALSLTLVPKKIPPQEVFLNSGAGGIHNVTGGTINGAAFGAINGLENKRAKRWETKHKYVDTIKKVMTSLAKSELPDGYQISSLSSVSSVLPIPFCKQEGVEFDWDNAQALFGHHLNVVVGVAHNVSQNPVEISASPCMQVAAFSAWPEVYLRPGEKTEVYIIRKQNNVRQVRTKRPSLLNF